jgi:general secretion pathway protein K
VTAIAAARVSTRAASRGFALVSVLWAVSTLALVAASIATAGALSYAMSRNALAATQVELAIEAALSRAVLGLLDQRLEYRWRIDGAVEEFAFEGARIRVAIQDERGKIDLNAADRSLIESLLLAAGTASREASALADRVLEWRSSDDRARQGTAAEDYRLVGRAYRPRHGPFQTIDELNLLLGVTPELFARLEPAITVHSQRPGFDPETAPQLVLMTDTDAARAERIIQRRHEMGSGDPEQGRIPPGVLLSGRIFSVRVDVPDAGASREIVIQLTGDALHPYWIRGWR